MITAMDASFVGRTALARIIGQMLTVVLEVSTRPCVLKPTLERLKSTLKCIAPSMEDEKLVSDISDEQVQSLINQIEEGTDLVYKCSDIRSWNFYLQWFYGKKLESLNKALQRFFNLPNLQAQLQRGQREALLKIKDMHMEEKIEDKFDNKTSVVVPKTMAVACEPPEPPEFTVGLDEPCAELKRALLREGMDVLLLTASAGFGKTTLAKKLCWDEQVKGKFGDNIFFVTFSPRPNVKDIVWKLLQHNHRMVTEIESDEDAINQLESLMKQLGSKPVLLVVDDVWPDAEPLVKKFVFQLSDYKILVTSRFALKTFRNQHFVKPLSNESAASLFRHSASIADNSPYTPCEEIVEKIVKDCWGCPLALEVIGGSLRQQPAAKWKSIVNSLAEGHSILDVNTYLVKYLKKSLDVLGSNSMSLDCFMDLGLFPEDQRISASALIDIWVELYKLDEDGVTAMSTLYDLSTRNLAQIFVTRKPADDTDNYYSNHFVMRHDVLRDLAIYQSSQEPLEQRKRLIVNIDKNNFPDWWRKEKELRVAARILSISTDDMFDSNWFDMLPSGAEVLVLNFRGKKYTLPEFISKMRNLKVLEITNDGYYPTELENSDLLGSLTNLRRIRLEQVSVPFLCRSSLKLENLRKLSLFMCDTNQAFETGSTQLSTVMPNLIELCIDYCNDLVELSNTLCDIVALKKLSITNCHKLRALPNNIGNLNNLEVLRLASCTDIEELPDSLVNLQKLRLLDISECINLEELPEDMSKLCNLTKLRMTGCSRLSELPSSVVDLKHLRDVTCDEETAALWEPYMSFLRDLRIQVPKVDVNLDWLLDMK